MISLFETVLDIVKNNVFDVYLPDSFDPFDDKNFYSEIEFCGSEIHLEITLYVEYIDNKYVIIFCESEVTFCDIKTILTHDEDKEIVKHLNVDIG